MRELAARYGQCDLGDADYVVALGDDGTVLEALYAVMAAGTLQPVFAMRLAGSVGHLANPLEPSGLSKRLRTARRVSFHPLKADVEHPGGHATLLAINEIVLMRQRLQAARLQVTAGQRRFPWPTGDGLVIATRIGSSGYNRSAGGPVSSPGLPDAGADGPCCPSSVAVVQFGARQ